MQKVKSLNVVTTQGVAGVLTKDSQFVFNYTSQDSSCEIALSMPLRAKSFSGNILPGVLRQNMPEGFLGDWIRERLAKVARVDDMSILSIAGREVIGRVRCLVSGDDGAPKFSGESLNDILTWKGTEGLFEHLANQYAMASGISGVQPKVVVPIKQEDVISVEKVSFKDKSLIVKASGAEYEGLAENEFFCMSIAKNAGLLTPNFWLSDNKELFVVERFDIIPGVGYLGFEDMTSIMNKQNAEKYNGSYEMVAKAVSMFSGASNRIAALNELFASITVSIILRNGDAHLKNFGLLYTNPSKSDATLSPLFDIVNTTTYIPRDVLALKMEGTKLWPTVKSLIQFGKAHCSVDQPLDIIEKIVTAAMEYRPPETSEIWGKIRAEIEHACYEMAHKKVFAIVKPLVSYTPFR